MVCALDECSGLKDWALQTGRDENGRHHRDGGPIDEMRMCAE
ncbi:hypothetical protein Mal4_35810 [Maioricimonas rarisocia]|uniref:Uncharacterized protein n=1 Tax=Maioricimonas rarisocia TaxID=2528026 RepID=A0A517Z9T5_9PLAN|nr:hypothetical protein Mal4_35810 [Maioricimonas rarisocia]